MSLVLLLPLPRVRNDHLRMTSADFDSKPLERGAKLFREISAYRNAKLWHIIMLNSWNFLFLEKRNALSY
ncbi:hypothetical protein AB3S75_040285 [Citrus x aurantiifolia]